MGVHKILYSKGDKVGGCIYVEDTGEYRSGQRMAQFVCECGNIFVARIVTVKNRTTLSCGCLRKDVSKKTLTTHGLSFNGGKKAAECQAWQGIKQRCYNKNNLKYNSYGGRGISVCERWLTSYSNFYEDMGRKPSSVYSIERVDVNGNYEPSNCKWATAKAQANNWRRSLRISFNDETKTLAQWCNELSLRYSMVLRRLQKRNYIFDPIIFSKEYFKYSKYKKAV